MRKSRVEAAATRRRIVETAAAGFRRNGIGDSGLIELMGAAGLTRGAFYRHFESKAALVAEACALAAAASLEKARTDAGGDLGAAGLGGLIAGYLSTEHRDDPDGGCLFASLGSELGRGGDAPRCVATAGFLRLVDLVAAQYDDPSADESRARAIAVVSGMVGALTLSRIVADPALSTRILHETEQRLAKL